MTGDWAQERSKRDAVSRVGSIPLDRGMIERVVDAANERLARRSTIHRDAVARALAS